ncbi:hypothetical protein CDIK_0892 [Cucumispora dikerogammari]|nr:hypothetical protein CDIK_0892 [Cucumispora dikerogammari]
MNPIDEDSLQNETINPEINTEHKTINETINTEHKIINETINSEHKTINETINSDNNTDHKVINEILNTDHKTIEETINTNQQIIEETTTPLDTIQNNKQDILNNIESTADASVYLSQEYLFETANLKPTKQIYIQNMKSIETKDENKDLISSTENPFLSTKTVKKPITENEEDSDREILENDLIELIDRNVRLSMGFDGIKDVVRKENVLETGITNKSSICNDLFNEEMEYQELINSCESNRKRRKSVFERRTGRIGRFHDVGVKIEQEIPMDILEEPDIAEIIHELNTKKNIKESNITENYTELITQAVVSNETKTENNVSTLEIKTENITPKETITENNAQRETKTENNASTLETKTENIVPKETITENIAPKETITENISPIETETIEDPSLNIKNETLKNKEAPIHGQRTINFKAAFSKMLNEFYISISDANAKLANIKMNQDSYSMTVESSHYDSLINELDFKKINKEILEKNFKKVFKHLCVTNNVNELLDSLENKSDNYDTNWDNKDSNKITAEVLDSHYGDCKKLLYNEIKKTDCTKIEARNKYLNERILQERQKYEYNKSILEDLLKSVNDKL